MERRFLAERRRCFHKSRMFTSADDVSARLSAQGYLPSREIAIAVFLADRLEKPILVEGPAGVGKTDLARAFAAAADRELVRLQCYEGLDEAKAIYEWEYAKQLLYTQLLRERVAERIASAGSLAEAADLISAEGNVFFSERFLLPRAVLRAISSERPALLLVDEVDKADPEFEAFLLEVLSDWAVTIPEVGTWRASSSPPTPRASSPTPSGAAASTSTSTIPPRSASSRSCARAPPRWGLRSLLRWWRR